MHCAVRRLHVAAASEPAARRFVTTLEDALRCATLPGDDRRVVVVRRLALGRVAHDAGTQRLSLLIEQRIARGEIAWAAAHEPPDAAAELVGFASALQARTLLARRIVQGLPCDAWYWPLAVAEHRRALEPRDLLRAIARTIAAWPEARVALPEWAAQLVRAGGAAPLAAAIELPLARALLREAGIAWPDGRALQSATAAPPDEAKRAGAAAAHVGASAPAPPGTTGSAWPVWLQALLVQAPSASRTHASVDAPVARPASSRVSPRPASAAQPADASTSPQDTTRTVRPALESNATTASRIHATAPADAAPIGVAPRRPAPPIATDGDWRPTACGGLLFLLPVLARAGLVQGESPDDTRIAALRVLQAALRRVRAPDDDPAWRLLADLPALAPAAARDAQARASHELALARRWLHRHARIGLVSLVRRPARLSFTSTHIDLRFTLAGADPRVRRAGLDLDPGWLPWFGRVVAFQFVGRQP